MAVGKLPEADLEGGEESIFADINITPLTDLFLVMLIIFMVSASAAMDHVQRKHDAYQEQIGEEQRSGLKVDLPAGSAQEIDPSSAILVVAITAQGDLAINDQRVKKTDLEMIFRSVYATEKGTQVVIRADTTVHHGTVVEVMELAKRVGLTRLAIQTSSAASSGK